MTISLAYRTKISAFSLFALPAVACVFIACTGDDTSDDLDAGGSGGKAVSGSSGTSHGGASKGGTAGTAHGGALSAGAGGASEGGMGGAMGGEGGSFAGGEGGSFAGGEGGVTAGGEGGSPAGGEGGSGGQGGAGAGGEGFGGAAAYDGPSVGRAKTFAALAYSAITSANISVIRGELGVSAAAVSSITDFDATFTKYGNDSLAPNSQRTILAQQDVTALVGDIDPRPCDTDLTNVVGGLTGDITLHPGVTCMNSTTADVLINGHVYLDAGGDPNAFFVIRGKLALNVANGAEVVLQNGAQACGVFWRIATAVTLGTTVKFFGTVVAGSAITMNSGSTLNGRALAQTAGVHLDANSVLTPLACTHVE